MQQASQNALLLNALVVTARSSAVQPWYAADVEKAIDILAYHSKEEVKQKHMSNFGDSQGNLTFFYSPIFEICRIMKFRNLFCFLI